MGLYDEPRDCTMDEHRANVHALKTNVGPYPGLGLTSDGDTICPGCASYDPFDTGWIVAVFVHYEGWPEVCCECNGHFEAVYGNPYEEED